MTTVDRPTTQGWVADDSTFGARLALVRQRMHWGNVKEAAVACGLPPESWRSWERDGRVPQRLVDISQIIADRTGCDFVWLVTGPDRLRAVRGSRSAHVPDIAHYLAPPERTTEPARRPRDNRPSGHPSGPSLTTGVRRTARLPRSNIHKPR